MSSTISQPAAKAVEKAHPGNRRRNGYELTRQRDMLPIALGAGVATLVLHALAWVYFPSLMMWNIVPSIDQAEVEVEEVVRVVVREKPEEEIPESDPVETPPDTEPEEILTQEPTEIDILDIESIDALSIMPGETEIALPRPVLQDENPNMGMELAPEALDLDSLPREAVPHVVMEVPEPVPVNSNIVVANVIAQPDTADEASALMEKALRDDASIDGAALPGDTRSLAELMGVDNPGAASGVARLGADLLFSFDKSELKNSARITMLQLAALILKNLDTNFIIEGHTDSFGSRDYNALLALQRAAAVREWLVGNAVPVDNVYIRPCGNNNPLVDVQGSKDDQSLNRRVEIHMRRKDEALPPGCVPPSVKVDTKTPVRTQIARGERVPEAYASAYGKEPAAKAGTEAEPQPKATGKADTKSKDKARPKAKDGRKG